MNILRKIKQEIRKTFKFQPLPPPRSYLPPEMTTIRLAEVKAGDTIVVSLPRFVMMDREECEKIEQTIRRELKMPEGVNVAVFFGQVDIFHLRKI